VKGAVRTARDRAAGVCVSLGPDSRIPSEYHFAFCPASSQSTDLPNALLIANSTAEPSSVSPFLDRGRSQLILARISPDQVLSSWSLLWTLSGLWPTWRVRLCAAVPRRSSHVSAAGHAPLLKGATIASLKPEASGISGTLRTRVVSRASIRPRNQP